MTHPVDLYRRPGQPKLHYGRIGSANTLLKNPRLRDALRDSYNVRAIEMEGSGIADGTWTARQSYILIRGICDYCDSHKDEIWQGYAAAAAAAYARALIAKFLACTDPANVKAPTEWPRFHDVPGFPLDKFYQGRVAEREELSQWLCRRGQFGESRILALTGIAGSGKSTLAWVWAKHDVAGDEIPGIGDEPEWVSARCGVEEGWRRGLRILWFSFYAYEGGGDFNRFLEEAIVYFSAGTSTPEDFVVEGRIDHAAVSREVLHLLRQQRSLVVWDGAERLLVEYSGPDAALKEERDLPEVQADAGALRCVELRIAQFLWGLTTQTSCKLLLVSRLPFQELATKAGCEVKELLGLDVTDAVRFLRSRGVTGPETKLAEAANWFECHPLSLSNLVAALQDDFQDTADIRDAAPVDRGVSPGSRRRHILERAYDRRADHRRELLSRIAAMRGVVPTDVIMLLARDIPGMDINGVGRDLGELVRHGLLRRFPGSAGRFDLHPVVRRYVYSRLRDKKAVHRRLAEYFSEAGKETDIRSAKSIEELSSLIELYHHWARAGMTVEAFRLWKGIHHPKLSHPVWNRFAAFRLAIELLEALFPDGITGLPAVREEHQPVAVHDLALAYARIGRTEQARELLKKAIELQEQLIAKHGDIFQEVYSKDMQVGERRCTLSIMGKDTLAMMHGDLGRFEMDLGNLKDSERELLWAAKRYRSRGNPVGAVVNKSERIELLTRLGAFKRADRLAIEVAPVLENDITLVTRLEIAVRRGDTDVSKIMAEKCVGAFRRVSEQYDYEELAIERDYLLGAAERLAGNLRMAEDYLARALARARRIGLLGIEVESQMELGRVYLGRAREAKGEAEAAEKFLEEAEARGQDALEIARWCAYLLKEADCHILLSEVYAARGQAERARESARTAMKLACCRVDPASNRYYYKPAYEQASKLLAK